MRWVCSFLVVSTSVLGGATVGAAQPDASFAGDFNAENALTNVYGALELKDRRLGRYENFNDDQVYVEALFDAAFEERGATKHMVIATLTPRPRREYSCHACSPILGGAVFRREGDAWFRDSVGEVIQVSNAWNASLQLMQIGPERFALLHQVNDVHGGTETKQASLIFGVGEELAVHFHANGFEAPGPGACALPEQHLIVTAVDDVAQAQEYFDLVVDAKWNAATCRTSGQGAALLITSSGEECRRVSRYRFREGVYQLLSTEIDECTSLDEKTVPLGG